MSRTGTSTSDKASKASKSSKANRTDRATIVGVGETRYARWGRIGDVTEHALACEAILRAVADAGLEIEDVDGLTSFAEDRNEAVFLAAELGLPALRFANMVWMPGGGGGCAAVANAAMAVETGQAEVVVVYRSLCQGQFFRFGSGGVDTDAPAPAAPRPPTVQQADSLFLASMGFVMPYGLLMAAAAYALPTRRHMHLYGTTSEQLGRIAVTFREHANRNPRAVMHDRPMTIEDHQASPMIADPHRLFDCCLESDGACAVVVTTAERARDLRGTRVEILASEQGAPGGYGFGPFSNANVADELYATGGGEELAARLWGKAGVGPSELEDFGFCARGEGGAFVESGALSSDGGRLPTNTHGGGLSEAYIHGLNHVVEGVRSLRGDSANPVDGAEVCLVTSGACVPTSALVLGKS
jgi:acetyl-CoA acetyltransferase